MAVVVVDKDNFMEHAAPGVDEIKAGQPVTKEIKADDKPKEGEEAAKAEDIEALDPEDREDKLITDYVKRKIGKKHRAMKEAQEERDEANRLAENQFHERWLVQTRAEQLERELQELKAKVQPTPEALEDLEPKRDDPKYATDQEAYWTDRMAWTARKAVRDDRQKQEQDRRQAEFKTRTDLFNARLEEEAKEMPDLLERVRNANTWMAQPVLDYIALESEIGGKLTAYLVTHAEDAARIGELSKTSVRRAIAEIGKIEDKLTKPKEPPKEANGEAKVTTSKAPEPIKPLSGADTGTVHKPRSEWTTRETIEYEEAQRAHKSQRRQRH
ncbi:MAG TPA: hypothetical protein VMS08_06300 [Candidatus Saccharimonadia bacterium]|nr:hypothetical protein [Candidatus Saccharimonadia bacterium]